eukprot:gene843-10587_t
MSTITLRQSSLTAITNNRNERHSGKKSKLQDTKNNMVKPNKRAALGNITNVAGTRKQPSRAAKQNVQINPLVTNEIYQDENQPQFSSSNAFSIFVDEQKQPGFNKPDVDVVLQSSLSETAKAISRPPLADVLPDNLLSESPMVISSPCNTDCVVIGSDEVVNSSEIANIDQDSDKLLGVSEYAEDIYKYLRQAELKCRPKPGYMKKQTDINCSMRAILVDWLVEVAEEYKLMEQTLYLTVNYIDRFLSCMSVLRGKLQLVGTACMLIASKFEEIYPPEVSEFVYITDDTYTAKQVLRMENLILKTLKFDLSAPTALNFLERYIAAAKAPAGGSKLESLARFLCELTLQDYDPFLKYLPSTIAASCVCMASSTLGLPIWTPTLSYYTGYKLEELQSCVIDVHKTFVDAASHQQQAIRDKYKLVR